LIKKVEEGYLSELRPEEIPDDCVSEVDTNLETIEGAATDFGVSEA
jgi:hypothetical protein